MIAVPILGWFLSFFLALLLSIPTYFLWNHLAPTYFYWLPAVFHHIPFVDMVWLVMLIAALKVIFFAGIVTGDGENSDEEEEEAE